MPVWYLTGTWSLEHSWEGQTASRGTLIRKACVSWYAQAFFSQTCHLVPFWLLNAQNSSLSAPSSSQSQYQPVLGPAFSLGRDSWWMREGGVQSLFWYQWATINLLNKLIVLMMFVVLHCRTHSRKGLQQLLVLLTRMEKELCLLSAMVRTDPWLEKPRCVIILLYQVHNSCWRYLRKLVGYIKSCSMFAASIHTAHHDERWKTAQWYHHWNSLLRVRQQVTSQHWYHETFVPVVLVRRLVWEGSCTCMQYSSCSPAGASSPCPLHKA